MMERQAPTNPSDNHSILQVAIRGPVCKIISSRHLMETSLRSQHPLPQLPLTPEHRYWYLATTSWNASTFSS
ncbi:hypothetical protein TNCV_3614281 [Trichonephila clavipes]|uniref:Uncharacterized protein n=1 Tax=Trichonephila clavipes TaxID=2585209 RepID=A0A8X6VIP4_TRICX|nr:hypothetical protein TNCV_3614281 [Trichonephila clavipes]